MSPSIWLTAGVLCLGASILLGYHQDQMDAEAALAQKVQMPSRVIVQKFSSAVDENELSEIRVLAEAAVDDSIQIDVGNDGASRLLEIIPLYPVSRESFPIARSLSETRRRPAPRSEAGAIARRNAILAQIEQVPLGIMVFEADQGSQQPDLDAWKIGLGTNGPLFDLSGTHLVGSTILERAKDPLARRGVTLVENALVVAPYLESRSSKGSSDYSVEQGVLFWTSMGMIAFGLASMFSVLPSFRKAKRRSAKIKANTVESFPAISPFQPIADQDEISDDAEDEPAQKTSRIMTVATNMFRAKSRP
ncbi:MAG: hypothetical protein ABJK89_01725 [Paracoccaceae bacterium]